MDSYCKPWSNYDFIMMGSTGFRYGRFLLSYFTAKKGISRIFSIIAIYLVVSAACPAIVKQCHLAGTT